ncbi:MULTISPECIES: metallophosphoesterase family protein [Sphingobacterium]|uniref:metallophosphoesterase family protein n=1 Tax=Sphingobacterium TaxID=28453 RepID=UPI0025796D2B|nr:MULTISPECIES: metallophosphoesterase [Sphingobacterium]
MINRKKFIQLGSLGLGSILVNKSLASTSIASTTDHVFKAEGIKFGVIADLHHDLMHDGLRRAKLFIEAMKNENPDFIISLADFCFPKAKNKELMAIWDGFTGERHFVIGNHDTDGGFTKQQVTDFWNSPAPYYSFDKQGFHFVILDGNEKSLTKKIEGYPRSIGQQQLEWLKKDIRNTKMRVIIFCHQGLDNEDGGLENGMAVRYLLEQMNIEAGFNKILLVLTGHHHLNYHNEINGIHYVQINSASYYWAGDTFESKAFDADFYKKHGILKRTLVYQDPIWATVSIDHKKNIRIQGSETTMAGIPLAQTGIDIYKDVYPISAKIDSRHLRYR